MFSAMLSVLLVYWPVTVVAAVVTFLVLTYFHHGLNKYPGPLVAKFTNFWRVYDMLKGRYDLSTINLHKKYGAVVRVGPNMVSLSDGEMVPQVFAVNKGWIKSRNNGRFIESLVMVKNEAHHSLMKKPIAGVYSQQSLTGYQPLVDETITLMIDQLEKGFGNGETCDLGVWLRYYAFDVILNLTFSNTMGFLESGEDAGGFIKALHRFADSSSIYFHVPWLMYFWRLNPVVGWFQKDGNIFPAIVRKQYQEHPNKFRQAKLTATMEALEKNGMRDFLYRFMAIDSEKPGSIGPDEMASLCVGNVIAGSDSTAIALRAIIYFVLKNPDVQAKLMAELREANLSYPVGWKESQSLPYLHACVQEALRMHPPGGFGLERVVPTEGCQLPNGDVLPHGTIVSMPAWQINRDVSIYGANSDEYRPERWLQAKEENDDAYDKRLSTMKGTFLTFGWGKRICLGRKISLLEIYKVVPTLLLEFEIELLGDWEVKSNFFSMQEKMFCKLKRRTK